MIVFLKRTVADQTKNIFPISAPETLRVPFDIGDTSERAIAAVIEKGPFDEAKRAIKAANKLLRTRLKRRPSVAFKRARKKAEKALSDANSALDAEADSIDSSFFNDPPEIDALDKETQGAFRHALQRTRTGLDALPHLREARDRASIASVTRITKNRDYSLRATINHTGTAVPGHYIARILAESGWLECNDSTVTPIKTLPSLKEDYSEIQPNTIVAALYEKDERARNKI